jgi:hypothetical protein
MELRTQRAKGLLERRSLRTKLSGDLRPEEAQFGPQTSEVYLDFDDFGCT